MNRKEITRRNFLKYLGATGAVAGLSRCTIPVDFEGLVHVYRDFGDEETVPYQELDLVIPHSGSAGDYDLNATIFQPLGVEKSPVYFHSHGFGGFGNTFNYRGSHLAQRGYTAVTFTHEGDKKVKFDEILVERTNDDQIDLEPIGNLEIFQPYLERLRELPGHEEDDLRDFAHMFLVRGLNGDIGDNPLSYEENNVIRGVFEFRPQELYSILQGVEEFNYNELGNVMDFDNIALGGHSAGGITSITSALSSKTNISDNVDFSNYSGSIKAVISQAGAVGLIKSNELNYLDGISLMFQTGELDQDKFTLMSRYHYENNNHSPECYINMADTGHLLFDELGCLEGLAGIPQMARFISNIANTLVGENTLPLPEMYARECYDSAAKHRTIRNYVNAMLDLNLKGRDEAADVLMSDQEYVRDFLARGI
jgi:predicted dienelactone hydrolase